MDSSRTDWRLDRGHSPGLRACVLSACVVLGALGCSVGQGQGELTGSVRALECGIDDDAYSLEPSFFGGEVTGGWLNIRVQRGSDLEQHADGLAIHVRDVNEVKQNRLGLPIPVEADHLALVQMSFYLNEACPSGFPSDHRLPPVVMEAVGGQIRFDSIYAPDLEPGDTLVEAELLNVTFTDRDDPEGRAATLSGTFSFFQQRGAPAQRFP
ncbi:MAG: hypothetical protein VYE22_11420 [Myxococcota bacterium]|nr:hypothetical protein [Myxococcota bacterium]